MNNNTKGPQVDGSLLPVRISLGLFVLLHGLPFILKDLHPWGLDQWEYIPAGWAWASLIISLLILLPPVSTFLAGPLEQIGQFGMAEKSRRKGLLVYLFVLAVAAAVFWTFRNATYFLGDGFLWANHLIKDIVFREPVSTWLYRGLYRGLNAVRIFGEISPVRSSAITSVLAGLVFVVFTHRTARVLSEKRGDYILIITSLLSCGTIMLFFGYVETYPPVAAGVMAFLFYALRWFKRGGSILPVVLAFLVTVILHLSAIALLPGLLLLLHLHAGKRIERKGLAGTLIIVAAAGFAGMFVLQATGVFDGFFREHFLPLFTSSSSQDVSYPVFSLRALFDHINELLLISPLVVLVPVLLPARRRQTNGATNSASAGSREHERMFLAVSALFYVLVFIVFNKIIGTSRDWDLFSPIALPLVLWIALLLRDILPGKGGELSVLTLAIIVTHTAPWITLNADLIKSEERFVDLCDNGYWSNRAKGYGYSTLGQYYRQYGKTLPAIQFYGRAAVHDPGNVKYNYYVGEMYSNLGKHGAALEHYFKVLERDGGHLDALNNAGVSYLELGRPSDAEPYLSRALEIDPASISAMQNLGYIYLVTGRTRKAAGIYLQAVELEPANYMIHISLAKAFIAYGDIESARRHIDAARSIEPRLAPGLLEDLQKETVGAPGD